MKTLRALFWGCVTGAALAYIFAPRRIDLLRAKYGIGAQSSTGDATTSGATRSNSATTTTGRATSGAGATTTPTATPTTATTTDASGGMAAAGETRTSTLSAVNSQTATAENAAFIGNTHTRVYHSATDLNLPNEENRAYFATAEDAEEAGYRPAGQTTSV